LFISLLFYELGFPSFKFLLAGYTAKIVGFALICDFIFGCVFSQNHSANWVPEHFFGLNLVEDYVFRLLWLMVQKRFSCAICSITRGKNYSFPYYKLKSRVNRLLNLSFLVGASGGLRSRDHYLTKVTPHRARLPRHNDCLSEQNAQYEIKSLRFAVAYAFVGIKINIKETYSQISTDLTAGVSKSGQRSRA
jgi:hypothetical protein